MNVSKVKSIDTACMYAHLLFINLWLIGFFQSALCSCIWYHICTNNI